MSGNIHEAGPVGGLNRCSMMRLNVSEITGRPFWVGSPSRDSRSEQERTENGRRGEKQNEFESD